MTLTLATVGSRIDSLLAGLVEWVRYTNRYSIIVDDHRLPIPKSKIEKWREYEVARPSEQCVGHSRCWTHAPGVWHCRDCVAWYRTWERWPTRPQRQREGY